MVAYLVVVAFGVGALVLFLTARSWFEAYAHPIAAITMFALMGLNALLNGYNLVETRRRGLGPRLRSPVPHLNTYTTAGTLMLAAALVFPLAVRPHWHQWVFGLEAAEIALFAVFWIRQTVELWSAGLRPSVRAPVAVATARD